MNPGRLARRVGVVVALWMSLTFLLVAADAGERAELRYTTPSGITCIVTERGLSAVQTKKGEVASGKWELLPVGGWASQPRIPSVTPPELVPSSVQKRSLSVMGSARARVRHLHKNLAVIYDYVFEGEDLRISARVENQHAKADLPAVGFGGLRFSFPTAPTGVMRIYTEEEIRNSGLTAFHPSAKNLIGGSFASAGEFGVGLAPRNAGSFPALLSWQLERFGQNAGFRLSWAGPTLLWWKPVDGSHSYALHHIDSSAVRAEGARTFQLIMRLSPITDWRHLLEPWKRELATAYGHVRYEPVSRPVVYHPVKTRSVEPASGSGTTLWNAVPGAFGEVAEEDRDNPLGYADGEIRLDRPQDVKDYADRLLPSLQEANALGLIFRQIGGHDPQGLQYGAMFHMAPDRVHENIERLIATPFREMGHLVGLAGRPDRWPVFTAIDRCTWLPVDPDVRKHLGHMWGCRFRLTSIKKVGARMFLLEEFGDSLDDVRIMRYLREKMSHGKKMQDVEGPIHTFAEHPSDAMLFFSSGYTRIHQKDQTAANGRARERWRILRWLVPGACLYGLIESEEASVVAEVAEDLYSEGIGAIIYSGVLPDVAASLGASFKKYAGKTAHEPAEKVEPLAGSPALPADAPQKPGPPEQGQFTYVTEAGIEFHIGPGGLERIAMGDRTLAEGAWRTISPSGKFGLNRLQRKSLSQTGKRSCRVVHVHEKVRTTFDYLFDGEDLTIRAKVENNHPTAGINIARFGALTFHFRGQHDAEQLTPHSKWGWLANPKPDQRLRHMHPGWDNRVGGSYGADEHFGVGATPLKTGLTRTAINWKGGWGSDTRRLTYSAEKPIPPGGARTFYIKLRLSMTRDWRHLLEPYRRHFRELHGVEPRYKVDHRFVIQRMAAEPDGDHWKTERSPLAYHPKRRLDTPEGAKRWAESAVRTLNEAGGKGLIMWAQCGYQPRQMWFRSDFDVLPRPAQKSWTSFREVFDRGGKRFGVTVGRTYAMNYRWKWKKDNILPRATDLEHLKVMGRRFQRMMDRGATMFYLDMFGYRLGDIKAMRYYREHVLGPDVLTYCEGPMTDAILPYSGLRTGVRHSQKNGLHLHWGQDRVYYIARWLMSDFGTQIYARLHPMPRETVKVGEKLGMDLKKAVQLSNEQIYRWMFRHRMSVMNLSAGESYRAIQEEFLTPDGKWRNDLDPMDGPDEDHYREELERQVREEARDADEEEMDLGLPGE